MKKLHALLIAAFLAAGVLAAAAESKSKEQSAKKTAEPTESEIIAKARASYPTKTCITSDETIDKMEEATPYVHREAGKPPRVIFVCCEGCIDDFKMDPAKYLAKLDQAEAKAKKK